MGVKVNIEWNDDALRQVVTEGLSASWFEWSGSMKGKAPDEVRASFAEAFGADATLSDEGVEKLIRGERIQPDIKF